MPHVLSAVPAWIGILLYTVIPAGIAVAAHAVFRRYVRAERLIPHHEVAGFLVAVVGVLYAVVLGFLVVTVWSAFDSAQRNADLEASDVAELFLIARAIPEPARSHLRSLMADYAFEVRDREWPMLGAGGQDPIARELLLEAFDTIAKMPIPASTTGEALRQSALQGAAFATYRDLSTQRRQRLLDAENHVQGALYFALILGALLVFGFVLLFGVERSAPQLTMTALVAGSIGLLFGLIVELDRPYGNGIRVTPTAFTFIIETNHLAKHRTSLPSVPE
jgi:uncharacterized protein YacL